MTKICPFIEGFKSACEGKECGVYDTTHSQCSFKTIAEKMK